jgi:hypothetical protein
MFEILSETKIQRMTDLSNINKLLCEYYCPKSMGWSTPFDRDIYMQKNVIFNAMMSRADPVHFPHAVAHHGYRLFQGKHVPHQKGHEPIAAAAHEGWRSADPL